MRWWCGFLAMVCALAGAQVHAHAQDLVVSAAASLTNAFRDIGKQFEAGHPGGSIVFNFAASDVLLAQIAKGAPADVFASADQDAMNRAEREGLVDRSTRRDFAANQLVLVVPFADAAVVDLAALNLPRFKRIAMGSPQTVPAGRYAKEALERSGLWAQVEPKLVFAQNVRQALDYVARGEAEAGFVYATDAAILPDKVKVALDVATATPVRYPIAAVAASRQADRAREFVAYVASAPAQQTLVRYGFRAP
jgi:molybdate transport system substrate-binding protein